MRLLSPSPKDIYINTTSEYLLSYVDLELQQPKFEQRNMMYDVQHGVAR